MNPRILVAGTDRMRAERIANLLGEGYTCEFVSESKAVLEAIRSGVFDVVVMTGDHEGAVTVPIADIRDNAPHVPVVMAGVESGEGVAHLLREGVYDYVGSDCDGFRLQHTLQRAMELGALYRANRRLKHRVTQIPRSHDLVGNSLVIEHLREKISLLGNNTTAVLITGEPGTGKRIVARRIHDAGPRSGEAFVTLSCAALPSSLPTDEIFGPSGRIDAAMGGTLVIDEIGTLDAPTQARLSERLAALVRDESVRVITTSSINLKEAVKAGNFREDLYYRINMVSLEIPPLRERRDDIPMLIAHFTEHFTRANGREPVRLTAAAIEKLTRAYWRGNVRELQNVIEQAVVLGDGQELDADYFSFESGRDERLSKVEDAFRFGSIREMERLMILNRLNENQENRTRSARTLDISVRTLRNKLHEYNVGVRKRELETVGS